MKWRPLVLRWRPSILTEVEARRCLYDEAVARHAQDEVRRARERAEGEQTERQAFEAWIEAGGLP